MSFLTYIVSSILLSWVGMSVYLLFRMLRPGLRARRAMLWLVLACSLTLPLTPPFSFRDGPMVIDNPIDTVHDQIAEFLHAASER